MSIKVIIIGAGPVGIRAIEEMSACRPDVSISLYGDEPGKPYNRVLLSNYLAGKDSFGAIRLAPKIQARTRLNTHFNCKITEINPEHKYVVSEKGEKESYDKLVIASGSHAHIPNIPNTQLDGVFTLRTLQDADALKARKSVITLVLGGGLLGLETARAIHDNACGKTRVTVIDHSLNLMSRQLNKPAGDLLLEKVLAAGIEVKLFSGITEIYGDKKIESVELRREGIIPCDTLVLAVGIRPNIELARLAGLKTRRGIVVNEKLQTTDPDIYAVGECIEYGHTTYGIVAPGYEQAKVMAGHLCGKNNRRKYRGSILATHLKVLDYPVFSMGRVGENESGVPLDRESFSEPGNYIYRHLVIDRRQLVGCIALGEWSELNRIRTAIENQKRIWPWQIKRFRKTGLIWADQSADSVVYWPDNEIVCNCNQVSRGSLGQAVAQGCSSIAALSGETDAGTTCGSCHSLLSELLGCQIEPAKAFKTLAGFSIFALIAGLIYFATPAIPFQQQATVEWYFDALWRNNFLKQVTGYTLLACSVIVLTLSLRKRMTKFNKGDFAYWRIMHVVIGVVSLLTLLAHTGFSLGENLNLFLMLFFVGLLVIGSLAGLVIASEHKLNPGLARTLRSQLIWGHILLFWPLPVLLGFHILQTYYF